MAAINVGAVVGQIAQAMGAVLGRYGQVAASYAQCEAEKIAISIGHIADLFAAGQIDAFEAKLKLDIQHNATRTMLLTIEGIGVKAAEEAINAGLSIVRSVVNTAIGFALL